MLKSFIKWLFGKEFDLARAEILDEAREIVSEAKSAAQKQYVRYERVPLGTDAFLYGINPVLSNVTVISWLMGQRENCVGQSVKAMVSGEEKKVLYAMAQVTMIDSLFADMEKFGNDYDEMLRRKKQAQTEVTYET
jgi:hypothetical protein